ncbi:MAG TPA: hypothetical protein VF811_05870 [Parasulfuritortus sp.]
MSQEKTFRINLPTLFERVNERRREQGLPSVEPAIMAVRASIKFAIRRQKHMDLKDEKGEVEMDEGDADALCQTLGELFNVDLHFDGPETDATAPSAPAASLVPPPDTAGNGEMLVLPLFQFYGSINRERRNKGLQPIEPAVISVRTGIKFSIMQRRTLNFRDNALALSEADLRALDGIVAQQFDANIPGGLRSLCRAPAAEAPAAESPAAPAAAAKGFLSRLFGRNDGKPAQPDGHEAPVHKIHYSLDTSNLLLAIITRRAYLGHKPITPDKVKRRCGKAFSAELELDMDEEKIALPPEQLDAFAEIIRKEFEIMFDDLDDLLGKKLNK